MMLVSFDVLDAPRCEDLPLGSYVAKVVGSAALLPCTVAGNPFPQIEWSKNGGLLPEGRYAITTKGLTISNLKKEDGGSYQVTLRSIAGTVETVLELIVKSKFSLATR